MTLLRSLVLLLLLARSATAAELVPAGPADHERLARLFAAAWFAWADGDTDAILADEDGGLLEWLEREHVLAMGLAAGRLLPPFGGEPWPCVPVWTTLRILELREDFPSDRLASLSVAARLERLLQFSAHSQRTMAALLASNHIDRAALEADPAAALDRYGMSFVVDGDRAYFSVLGVAISLATRPPGGRWDFDWRLPLALEELLLRHDFRSSFFLVPGIHGKPPAEWPVDLYLDLLAPDLPGHEELRRLAEPPRPDPAQGCWDPLRDPTLLLCQAGSGWEPCAG